MPLSPRIYAIPAMPSYKEQAIDPPKPPMDWESPELWAKLDELKAAIRASKESRILPTVGDYLDAMELDNYCRTHDMFRPCHWCD